jgi:hypothetical protein
MLFVLRRNVMVQITVKELLKLCEEEIKNGNGDKHIVISDDNEGNGYHGMFYGFSEVDDLLIDDIYDSNFTSKKDTIILG